MGRAGEAASTRAPAVCPGRRTCQVARRAAIHPFRMSMHQQPARTLPASISAISLRMEIMASQKRSSSALLSLSVGSIISVPV